MAVSVVAALSEFNMSSEPLIQVKAEPLDCNYDEPIDLDELQPVVCDNPVLIDLSNRQREDCSECNDRNNYECSACVCAVCGYKTSPEKRFRCVHCLKVFHEWCRVNQDSLSEQWSCSKCKEMENWHSSTTPPSSGEVAEDTDGKCIEKTVIKSEKIDCNANSTLNESTDLDPSLDKSFMDIKEKIVDRIARNFMRPMHHASRTKECLTVPKDHFGPIPGVAVGTCWRFRLQVSEAGVHRPLVGGIHARHHVGAYSIVLSGVYDDDQDFGDEFLYCGSGGRAKDKSKRYSAQITDQKLDHVNRGLALCCNAPLNDKDGAEAEDWRAGKPVRVTRNYRLRKHSKYAPEEGNRYDGIYKVVKYFPTVGKVGLIVWKFLMRRDDPEPAPWTEEGKKNIERRNLAAVIWPEDNDFEDMPPAKIDKAPKIPRKRHSLVGDGLNFPDLDSCTTKFVKSKSGRRIPRHLPNSRLSTSDSDGDRFDIKPDINALKAGRLSTGDNDSDRFDIKPDINALKAGLSRRRPGRPRGRSLNGSGIENSAALDSSTLKIASVTTVSHSYFTRASAQDRGKAEANAAGIFLNGIRIKEEPYELPDKARLLIQKDKPNKSAWEACKTYLKKGETSYRKKVRATFTCHRCNNLVKCPVTTPCEDNICLECIRDQFSQNDFSCPNCRFDLGSSFEMVKNENLTSVLNILFPDHNSEVSETV